MTERVIKVDTSGAMMAMQAARRAIPYADRALGAAAQEVKDDWQRLVPKAAGDLKRNIQRGRVAVGVHEIVSRSKHGRWVEEGTGLYGPTGRATGYNKPSRERKAVIALWIKRRGIVARKVKQSALPWIIARKIARDGTPAQPSAEMALNVNRSRVQTLVLAAIERAVNEAGLVRAA